MNGASFSKLMMQLPIDDAASRIAVVEAGSLLCVLEGWLGTLRFMYLPLCLYASSFSFSGFP